MEKGIALIMIVILAAALFAGVATGRIELPGKAPKDLPAVIAPSLEIDPEKTAVDATTTAGVVRGFALDGVNIFKGIPYAAAPVGELRWKAPAPPTPWEGVRSAQSFRHDCMQNRVDWDPSLSRMAMSEDCLTLNIWAPAAAQGAPVMVWIHGGGFVMGSASQANFDGAALARRGVVLVTLNYRLGRFGFFAHPELTAEAAGGATGNFGVMDQIAALKWLHENIASFGGDPSNITIFGESGGGASVGHLMAIAEAQGLFQKAIMESAGGRLRWTPIRAEGKDKGAEAAGVAFGKSLKADGVSLAALRALPAKTVLGEVSFSKLRSKIYSGPMIDGVLIKSEILESFAEGREARIPLIVGANSAELNHMPGIAKFLIRRAIKQGLKKDLKAIEAAYGDKQAMNENLLNDWAFVEPARSAARRHIANGAPAYYYEFDYVHDSLREKFEGARHASEMSFVFGNVDADGVAPTENDLRVAREVGAYWVAFAKTGAPDADGLPAWPIYDPASDERLTFRLNGPSLQKVRNAPGLDAITRASDGAFQ